MMAEVRCPECNRKLGENLVGIVTLFCRRCHKLRVFKDLTATSVSAKHIRQEVMLTK